MISPKCFLSLSAFLLLAAAPSNLSRAAEVPAAPRINSSAYFGVRPGAPVLYTIPATGERPMTFSAEGLPAGLSLNAITGQVTGTLSKAGEFPITFMVRNAKGEAKRSFKIVAGDTISLTPPMGWSSWNCFGEQIDQEKILQAAHALVANGLDRHGWAYINIDDGWQGERTAPDHALQATPERFPDMQGLCTAVHALGLKCGIYSTPWTRSFAGKMGGSSVNADGRKDTNDYIKRPCRSNKPGLPWAIGPYSFASADAAQWAKWGFDYLKYDWHPVEAPETKEMAEALHATGRDIHLSLSNNHYQTLLDVIGEVAPLAQSWRTTGDITDTWKSISDIGFAQQKWISHQSPGHYNDPDMLEVGWVSNGKPIHPTQLTQDEQYTHFSLWCLLSAPLLMGCDLEKLDAFTLGLLTNDEVIALDQDPLVKPARCVTPEGDLKVYVKELADGTKAIGLFNAGAEPATVTFAFKSAALTGAQVVRDLWLQKDLGTFSDSFSGKVASHGVLLLKVSPVSSSFQTLADAQTPAPASDSVSPTFKADWRWVHGAVFVPTNVVNEAQQWDQYDPVINDRELHYASLYGINCVRVYLHYFIYLKNKDALLKNVEDFLTRADRYGIKVEFVFFDDCWNEPSEDILKTDYHYPAPMFGVHNSRWLLSPGHAVLNHYDEHRDRLKAYVQDIVKAHLNDSRVAFWETYNEPHAKTNGLLKLIQESRDWVHETGTKIPVTATGSGFCGDPYSDFLTWHNYSGDYKFTADPITALNTECMCRKNQTVPDLIAHFKGKTGFIVWEFGIGRDDCRFYWGEASGTPAQDEHDLPFHGLVYADGHPWSTDDIKAWLGAEAYAKLPVFHVSYFRDSNFANLAKESITPAIDFDLLDEIGYGSPDTSVHIAKDYYSIRWTGDIQSAESGNATLFVKSDGAVKVRVGKQLIIDKKKGLDPEVSGTVALNANQPTQITVEYVHETGPASIHVSWIQPKGERKILFPVSHP